MQDSNQVQYLPLHLVFAILFVSVVYQQSRKESMRQADTTRSGFMGFLHFLFDMFAGIQQKSYIVVIHSSSEKMRKSVCIQHAKEVDVI